MEYTVITFVVSDDDVYVNHNCDDDYHLYSILKSSCDELEKELKNERLD